MWGGGGETSIHNLGKMEIYKLYPVWSISENGSNYPVSTAIYHSLATETGIHWLQRQAFTRYRRIGEEGNGGITVSEEQ